MIGGIGIQTAEAGSGPGCNHKGAASTTVDLNAPNAAIAEEPEFPEVIQPEEPDHPVGSGDQGERITIVVMVIMAMPIMIMIVTNQEIPRETQTLETLDRESSLIDSLGRG